MATKPTTAVKSNTKSNRPNVTPTKTKDSISLNSPESGCSSGSSGTKSDKFRKSTLNSPASGSSSGSSGRKLPAGFGISPLPWKSLEQQNVELKAPRAVTSYFKGSFKDAKPTKTSDANLRNSPMNGRLAKDFTTTASALDNDNDLKTEKQTNDFFLQSGMNDKNSPNADMNSTNSPKNRNQIKDFQSLKPEERLKIEESCSTSEVAKNLNTSASTSTVKSSKKPLEKPKKYPTTALKNKIAKQKTKRALNSHSQPKGASFNPESFADVEIEEDASPEELFEMLLGSVEQTENVNLQLQAIMTLTSASQEAEPDVKDMIAQKVLPVLVKLLYPKNGFDDCTFAALILSSFLDTCPEYCQFIISENVVEPLSILLTSGEIDTESLNNVTDLLLSLCQQNETIDAVFMQNILPKLASLLDHKDKEIVGNIMHTMLYLLKNSDDQMLSLFSGEVILKFIKSLGHFNEEVKMDTIRVISHIADGCATKLQLLIKKGDLLAHFRHLIVEKNVKLRNEALWCIANITSTRDNMFNEVEAADLLTGLGQNLKQDNFLTKKLSTWIISNLTFNIEKSQVEKLIRLHFVVGICKMFTLDDNQVSNFALNALRNMLEVDMNSKIVASTIEKCGGLEKIKKIVGQGDSNISEIASRVMARHFPTKKTTQPTTESTAVKTGAKTVKKAS